ncbi:MAG: hypothetical protein JXL97_05755 [Bacteroidales bacterium]|nr:hypothetical protein [Bacteroidales bacterium]
MYKYILLVVFFVFFSCNRKLAKVDTAQNFKPDSLNCNYADFDLANYFNIDQIARFENEIQRFIKMDSLNKPEDSCIVFVGSSSIRKWITLESSFSPLPVLNRGFGGSTFPELIYYSNELIFKYNPKIVVIYEGDNDQYFLSPYQIFECACYLEKNIHEVMPNTIVYFLSAKPSPSRREKIRSTIQTNKYLEALSMYSENTYYIDVWSPMFDENLNIRGDIFKKDSLHLNEEGYIIWYNVVFPVIEQKYNSKIP